jgi:hypothetical protein
MIKNRCLIREFYGEFDGLEGGKIEVVWQKKHLTAFDLYSINQMHVTASTQRNCSWFDYVFKRIRQVLSVLK